MPRFRNQFLVSVLSSFIFEAFANAEDCELIDLYAGRNSFEICPEGFYCFLGKEVENGNSIFPIARSYHGKDWELYAGRSSMNMEFVCETNGENTGEDNGITPVTMQHNLGSSTYFIESSCVIELPELDDAENEGPYILFECPIENVTRRDLLARFLDQTTFGVTRKDLNSFDDKDSVDIAMVKFLKDQIENVPATSHREYFRKLAVNHMRNATSTMRPLEVCDVSTKWRRYAFNTNDHWVMMKVKPVGDKYELSINDNVRTIVDDIDWNSDDYRNSKGSLNKNNQQYRICHAPDNRIGGDMRLHNKFDNNSCQQIKVNGVFGNPEVSFTETTKPTVIFNLPENVVKPSIDFYSENNPQELVAVEKLNDPNCEDDFSIDTINTELKVTIGLYKGMYFIHSPPHALLQNDIYAPAPDGGGKSTKLTKGKTLCSNAPMTQFNEEYCFLSYDEDACRYDNKNVLDFTLNHDSIRTIYQATVDDEVKETRYLFAIDGLEITEKSGTPSPCYVSAESRWAPVDMSECDAEKQGVTEHTRSFFAHLIETSNDVNPFVKDIYTLKEGCQYNDLNKKGFAVIVNEQCWKNVHQNHMEVYDMTYWYKNMGENAIKTTAEEGKSIFNINLSTQSSDTWNNFRWRFGRYGRYGDVRSFDDLHWNDLKFDSVKNALRESVKVTNPGVVVCGSFGEIANDPSSGGTLFRGGFDFATEGHKTHGHDLRNARKTTLLTTAVYSKDQLRQKMAWILSSILTIAEPSVDRDSETEKRVSYTDILVRNAFGSYRDILEEISFAPIMAENLSFLDSKSSEYHWEKSSEIILPDENFAREIMQLYSVGLCMLNPDGSEIMQGGGTCKPVYNNEEIMQYAKAWTGFTRQKKRGNIEHTYWWDGNNEVDAMNIRADMRDKFPKLGLNKQYVGDGYGLCIDRPKYHFLQKNAKFRLLGSTSTPTLMHDPPEWDMNERRVTLRLSSSSQLYNRLCDSEDGGSTCEFKSVVVIDTPLECYKEECEVDTLRVIEVDDGIFYEYVSEPCIEQAFFNDAKKVVDREYKKISCADPRREVAVAACCGCEVSALRRENYWGERVAYNTAQDRCEAIEYEICDFPAVKRDSLNQWIWRPDTDHKPFYWSSAPCEIKIKVDPEDGKIAIVYDTPDDDLELMMKSVQSSTPIYFPVLWENELYPTPEDNCGYIDGCQVEDNKCICTISVVDEPVFNELPSKVEILEKLFIGSFESVTHEMIHSTATRNLKENLNYHRKLEEVEYFYHDENDQFTAETIFKVTNNFGVQRLLKNVASTVTIGSFSFRNPPHFLSFVLPEKRDAYHETDAVLDHFFYHQNTAPFLATNIIKHFGISNPTPKYILSVSTAFKEGKCTYSASGGESFEFGSGNYGDLAALVACIILDPEARDTVLDLDPTHGSVLAPLPKLFKLMRSMEAYVGDHKRFIEFYPWDTKKKLGQVPYEIETVFSYFQADFRPAGRVEQALLVSPESQLLTPSYVVGMLNGMFQLIRAGMKTCWDGFFRDHYNCYNYPGNYDNAGYLSFSPTSSDSKEIIDELSTLLTGGRLSATNKKIIQDLYDEQKDAKKPEDAFLMAQELVVSTPEFHTSGSIVRKSGSPRVKIPLPDPSSEPYKAVVFVLLNGGYDSNNMLIPGCEHLKSQYLEKRGVLALKDHEMTQPIIASNQPCSSFTIHHKLPIVKKLYDSGDLLFFANTGAMDKQWTKHNYWSSKLKLFGHNTMQDAVQKLDYAGLALGTGTLGRLANALKTSKGSKGKPFQVGKISIQDFSYALIGKPGSTPQEVVGTHDNKVLNPFSWKRWGVDLEPLMYALNNATSLTSSIYAETWSSKFLGALDQSKFLDNILDNVGTSANFKNEGFSDKLEKVAKLIKVKQDRAVDRDLFFINYGGWDHHHNMKENLKNKFLKLNDGLTSFWDEMKAQGKENQVTVIVTSDFARTMTPNSQSGSDHGWGGHYFMLGGDVKGSQILGRYPDDLNGDYVEKNRGNFIPTTSWDSVFHGISQWIGVNEVSKLKEVIPGRDAEIDTEKYFSKHDIFNNA